MAGAALLPAAAALLPAAEFAFDVASVLAGAALELAVFDDPVLVGVAALLALLPALLAGWPELDAALAGGGAELPALEAAPELPVLESWSPESTRFDTALAPSAA